MSKKHMDSVPPSGDNSIDDPYPEEDEDATTLEQTAKKVLPKLKASAFWIVGLAFALLLFGVAHGAIFSLYVIILIALAIRRSRGKGGFRTFLEGNWKWVLPLCVLLPVVLPPVLSYYRSVFWTDWERVMNRPKIYYIWNADSEVFSNAKDKEKLARWDPGKDGNKAVQAMLLAAAHSVGIEADRLVPFDPALLRQDQPFTLVVFETVSAKVSLPVPATDEVKDTMVSRLQVYFITPTGLAPEEDAGVLATNPGSTDPSQDAKSRFRMVSLYAPQSLDIRFDFMTEGFHKSTGRPVDFEFIGEFVKSQEKKKDERKLKDGPG